LDERVCGGSGLGWRRERKGGREDRGGLRTDGGGGEGGRWEGGLEREGGGYPSGVGPPRVAGAGVVGYFSLVGGGEVVICWGVGVLDLVFVARPAAKFENREDKRLKRSITDKTKSSLVRVTPPTVVPLVIKNNGRGRSVSNSGGKTQCILEPSGGEA